MCVCVFRYFNIKAFVMIGVFSVRKLVLEVLSGYVLCFFLY